MFGYCKLYLFNKLTIRYMLIILKLLAAVFIMAIVQLRLQKTLKIFAQQQFQNEIINNLNLTVDDVWIPDAGDNVTGWAHDIVPNVVHYVLFQNHYITYVHLISIMSVVRIQKPDQIIIHCDCTEMDADDQNWDRIIKEVNKTNEVTLIIDNIKRPIEIFGKRLRQRYYHASDVTRYRIMHESGGIYIDNDVLITQPLNEFFKFEFTLSWNEGEVIGSQILIGNRNSRFAKLAIETYRAYNGKLWYFNAGYLPTKAILEVYPHLVHRVRDIFGTNAAPACRYFYMEYHAHWHKKYYAFHMLARKNEISRPWRHWCIPDESHFMHRAKFSDEFLKQLNTTFGEVGRYVLFGRKQLN